VTVVWTILAVIGWILLGVLALLLLVLFTPHGARIEYTDTWRVKVLIFGYIPVFSMSGDDAPKHKKEKPVKETEEPKSEEPQPNADEKKEDKPSLIDEIKALYKEEGVKGVLSFFGGLLKIVTGTLCRITRYITIRKLELQMRVGGKTADEIAVQYGRICAALFPTLSALSLAIRFRKTAVHVQPDFLSDGTDVKLRTTIWVWPFGIVWAALCAFVKLILAWIKLPKAVPAKADDHKPDKKTS